MLLLLVVLRLLWVALWLLLPLMLRALQRLRPGRSRLRPGNLWGGAACVGKGFRTCRCAQHHPGRARRTLVQIAESLGCGSYRASAFSASCLASRAAFGAGFAAAACALAIFLAAAISDRAACTSWTASWGTGRVSG